MSELSLTDVSMRLDLPNGSHIQALKKVLSDEFELVSAAAKL